jgi:hypothetical protein
VPDAASGSLQPDPELRVLHHRLSSQLGIILAHAELLEARSPDTTFRSGAAKIVASTLDALRTAREIRQATDPATP